LVRNLVDNAIRYTPRGGKVRVVLEREAGRLALHVIDSGPGIPAELRAEAGKRFRRFDESGSEGHGLGLSIVARIAELHGANLVLGEADHTGGLDVAVSFPLPDPGKSVRS
ncbi:MAG TPA: ATP-binding protein, partial [Azospira sp.]|nr:ATP-binding protein [Azospira sp.]